MSNAQKLSQKVAGGAATVPVGQGGTGVATITGLVKGAGTSAFAAATAGVDYQGVLVSGSNIKTVNGNSLLGSGDVTITTTGSGGTTLTGNVTLTSSSAGAMSVTPSAAGFYATLPNATTCTKAAQLFSIYNAGDFYYGIKDSAGTQLGWVLPRTGALIGLADNSTSAGVWSLYGVEKLGITAFYSNYAYQSGPISSLKVIPIDATRTFVLMPGADLYGIVFDSSTATWGSSTLIRSGTKANTAWAVLSASNQILVLSADSATSVALEAVTLTISGTTITVNTGTKGTATLSGTLSVAGQLIAVGSSFVASFYIGSPVAGEIRAISISGTTPTIGAASTLNATSSAGGVPAQLYASGSVVRTLVGSNTNQLTCVPYTVSGSTLSAGTGTSVAMTGSSTFKAIQNGNGRLVAVYLNTTQYATIFSLSGTTETASTVNWSSYASATNALYDLVAVSTSKVAVCVTSGTTLISFNIITDTSGTATAGTEVLYTFGGSISLVSWVSSASNIVRFGFSNSSNYNMQVTVDCSSSSPSITSAQSLSYISTSYAQATFSTSDQYGFKPASAFCSGTTNYRIAVPAQGLFDILSTPSCVYRVPTKTALYAPVFSGPNQNESWCVSLVNTANSGGIQLTRLEFAA